MVNLILFKWIGKNVCIRINVKVITTKQNKQSLTPIRLAVVVFCSCQRSILGVDGHQNLGLNKSNTWHKLNGLSMKRQLKYILFNLIRNLDSQWPRVVHMNFTRNFIAWHTWNVNKREIPTLIRIYLFSIVNRNLSYPLT